MRIFGQKPKDIADVIMWSVFGGGLYSTESVTDWHRLRVSKLSKTSHPSHAISVYGYIEYHRPRQRIYTEVPYPAMPRQVLEWLV